MPEWGFNQQDMAGSSAAAAQWMATETRNDFDSLVTDRCCGKELFSSSSIYQVIPLAAIDFDVST